MNRTKREIRPTAVHPRREAHRVRHQIHRGHSHRLMIPMKIRERQPADRTAARCREAGPRAAEHQALDGANGTSGGSSSGTLSGGGTSGGAASTRAPSLSE